MNWYIRSKIAAPQIVPFDEEADQVDDMDPYQMMDQADKAFQDSNIRAGKDKKYTHMAVENGQVIGAVTSGWEVSNEDKQATFAFDVAVSPQFRGPQMTGLKLIQQGIQHFQSERNAYQEMGFNTMMRLWVVNPRLVPILESKFGLEVEGRPYEDGSAHLVMY